ncbi:hypothetical protein [Paractinoplanes toevensis]|uniref:Uncharacterized protein n=1 Tax=Paractinoplanes toevensis TaxID=571911 RepID=A0A919WBQ4_9ACTN|nr:hypothetical protein [Actinoplanes toevensis]GIM97217.1 hypothetical protein Ato02nite_090100 [Actinoplanes toevensis]
MPQHPDDDLVPPIKVMRKRLNGVYRADAGFSGPTRRYVLLVALLVGLASVPTLAAITAGSNELADGRTDTMDVPVLPPALPGPVLPPEANLPQSGLPPSTQGGSEGADAAIRAGRLMGAAGQRRPRSTASAGPASGSGSGSERRRPGDRDGYAEQRRDRPSGSSSSGSGSSGSSGSDKGARPSEPSMLEFPALPGMRILPGLPSVSGRKVHRPGVLPTLPVDPPVDREKPDQSDSDGDDPDHHEEPPARPAQPCDEGPRRRKHERSTDSHRSDDRSEHSRRSTVTERPSNVRPASILELEHSAGAGHNRRHIPESRGEDNRSINHPYQGSHRAGREHRDDETAAQRRSSRVGRHHAEHSEDLSGHW